MISQIDRRIEQDLGATDFTTRHIHSRIKVLALSILVPIETVFNGLELGVKAVVFLILEPIILPGRIFSCLTDPDYSFEKCNSEQSMLVKSAIIRPAIKTAFCMINCFMTPLLGVLSPKTMLLFHEECGLYSREKLKPQLDNLQLDTLQLPESLKETIDKKFLQPGQRMAVLHGRSDSLKLEAAKYIAAKLNKKLVIFNSEDITAIENLSEKSHLIYVNIREDKNIALLNILKNVNFHVLASTSIFTSRVDEEYVHLQILSPFAESERKAFLEKKLVNRSVDYDALAKCSEGLSLKKIAKICQKVIVTTRDEELATKHFEDALKKEIKRKEKKFCLSSKMKTSIKKSLQAVSVASVLDRQAECIPAVNQIVLYGKSKFANKEAARFIASQLGKKLAVIEDKEDIEKLKTFGFSAIYYLNFENSQGLEKAIKKFKDSGMHVITQTDEPFSDETSLNLHIEVDPYLSESERRLLLEEELKGHTGSIEEIVGATKHLTLKKLQQKLQLIKLHKDNNFTSLLDTGHQKESVDTQDDYVVMKELQEMFDNYLMILKEPERAKEFGVKLPAGILLHGAPGCGKSYSAKHLCIYAKSQGISLSFVSMKASDVASKWKGEGIQKIRQKFEEAKAKTPALLFIDECEGLFSSRDSLGTNSIAREYTQEIDEVLQLIEDARNHNVIVVAATNHLSQVDPAIIRTGRFDHIFEVKAPDFEMRKALFKAKLRGKKCSGEIDFDKVAEKTEKLTASDIDAIVNSALVFAWKNNAQITTDSLLVAVGEMQKGREAVTAPKDEASRGRDLLQAILTASQPHDVDVK